MHVLNRTTGSVSWNTGDLTSGFHPSKLTAVPSAQGILRIVLGGVNRRDLLSQRECTMTRTKARVLCVWRAAMLLLLGAVSSSESTVGADVDKDINAAIDIISTSTEMQAFRMCQAFELIRRHPGQESLKALVARLDDSKPTRRRAVIYAFNMLPWDDGSPAFVPLRKLLTHSETLTRGMAGMALASLGDIESYDALVKMLEGDSDPYPRGCAAWALGELKKQEAVGHLQKALGETNRFVTSAAQIAIERLAFLREYQDVSGEAKSVYEGVWLIAGSEVWYEGRLNRAMAMIRSANESVRGAILTKLKSSELQSVKGAAFLASCRL